MYVIFPITKDQMFVLQNSPTQTACICRLKVSNQLNIQFNVSTGLFTTHRVVIYKVYIFIMVTRSLMKLSSENVKYLELNIIFKKRQLVAIRKIAAEDTTCVEACDD